MSVPPTAPVSPELATIDGESADAAPLSTDTAEATAGTGSGSGSDTATAVTRPSDGGPGAVRPRPSSSSSGRHQRRRLLVVGAVLAAAFAFLLVKGLGSSLDYFETVNQALQSKATLGTKTFRLEGLVLPGSVHRHHGGVDFVASGSKGRIDVVNTGNPPQLFQPDIPVVVVGHFTGATFVSNQIIVDHTAQYVAQYPNRVKAPNGSTR